MLKKHVYLQTSKCEYPIIEFHSNKNIKNNKNRIIRQPIIHNFSTNQIQQK